MYCSIIKVEISVPYKFPHMLVILHSIFIDGDRTYSIAAPQVWNELPQDVTNAPTLCIFECKLTTHLFDNF